MRGMGAGIAPRYKTGPRAARHVPLTPVGSGAILESEGGPSLKKQTTKLFVVSEHYCNTAGLFLPYT